MENFVLPTSTPPPTWIGKREYQFRKHSMLSFGPDITVLNKIDAPTQECANICFNRDFFEDIAREATGKRNIIKGLEYAPSSQLMQTILLFEHEVGNYGNGCPLMIQSICVQLAIQVLRCMNINGVGGRKYSRENNYVNKAKDYMHAYCNAGISINDICKEINLSPFHFIRLFKAQTGKTPYQYLLEVRMQQAETLLKGGCSVEEAARLCGFVNPGHFSSLFRRIVGITPSSYRKKYFINFKE
ncbi:helix-turn-helix domain-containing protein [Desulfallas thermosapovorans]|uniref:helix-turn-helix domain-containing protein n=1 Tax=Desulfallas thermosapovorans TaxID=58137 RepID=UPI0014131078|nr:AraC family transcriptional regulator [Desulfallas thermosapovorans]